MIRVAGFAEIGNLTFVIDGETYHAVQENGEYYLGQSPPAVFTYSRNDWKRTPVKNVRGPAQYSLIVSWEKNGTVLAKSTNIDLTPAGIPIGSQNVPFTLHVIGYQFEQGDTFQIEDISVANAGVVGGDVKGNLTVADNPALICWKKLTITARGGGKSEMRIFAVTPKECDLLLGADKSVPSGSPLRTNEGTMLNTCSFHNEE